MDGGSRSNRDFIEYDRQAMPEIWLLDGNRIKLLWSGRASLE
jgi:hypothetical protein